MLASWWDNLHGSLWRIAGRADLLAVQRSARLVAREFAAPLRETRSACGWSADQARLLAALDANGLTGILSAEPRDLAMHLSLSLWELASVDGGTATLSMSGFLRKCRSATLERLSKRIVILAVRIAVTARYA